MKRVVAALLAAGCFASSFATPARILGMGKHDAFFMDEMSIFRNPANISVYPNMLMGSYGEYRVLPSDTAGGQYNLAALNRTNRDPRNPYFGAIFTYSLQQSAEAGNQYPMVSVGGFFNRKDEALSYLIGDSSDVPEPLGKVDLMFSYAFANGGMVGIGGYIAHQIEEVNETVTQAGAYKVNLGLNWPIARSMDLEANTGIALLRSIGIDTVGAIDTYDTIAGPGDMVFNANVRLFSALNAVNGDFVPQAGIKYFNLYEGDVSKINVNGGVGVNINIDKGFFWAGIEGLYNKTFLKAGEGLEEIGGRVSFGIERNIIWDWFLIRVGGMKTFIHTTENKSRAWKENPEHDADDDLVGLGFGINIENRLKLDILVAEDVQNTLTNLISGPQHHIFTRIDATFSF
jgi:hypothetical protein